MPTMVFKPTEFDAAKVEVRAGELTHRMRETLEKILGGFSEKEMAQLLQLSPHTVHLYIKKLYRHFGVVSRSELQAMWLQSIIEQISISDLPQATHNIIKTLKEPTA